MRSEGSTGSLWRHQDFLKLWAGQTVSLLGSQVTVLALPLTAILLFHASPYQVGVLSAVEFLPFLLFGLPVGVWIDRMPKRPVLVIADLGRFATLASVPVAKAFGVLTLPHLYAAAFLTGVGTVFFDVAYGAYLPALVAKDRLVDGNAKLETSRAGAQLAGPGLAGVLVQAFGGPTALLADAASYVVSVVSLLTIRSKREAPASPLAETSTPVTARRGMRQEVREGVRFVARHALLRPVALCTAILNLFSMMGFAVLVLFAVRDLHMRAGVIGAALTVGNVGFLVGAPLASRIGRRLGVGPSLIGAAAAFAAGAALIPLATRSTGLEVVIAGTVVGSFGNVVYNVNARSLIQTITPPGMLGRAIATARVVVWGVIPVGALLGGVLGTHLGLRPTLIVSAAGVAVAVVPPLLSPVRSLRQMPTADPAPAKEGPRSGGSRSGGRGRF